uniref:NADH-ubiquinone oxidoreductase chain 3 n=1 Tax=Thrips hawaiiensis TaxID=163894 RepID=A0A8A0Y1V2_9NEOP|nr:NADH dehydrogenase subunit 3 [Thrips hawaiiensis]QSQ87281.1 NADH dehydrogenase subunit 3 [Thrips hawaiiensis]
MFIMIICALTCLIVTFMLVMISIVISKKSKNFRDKLIPFECGFNFFNPARMPFSMQFFLIAIIFIIFDVEIILMVPLITTIFKSSIFKWTTTSIIFLVILMLGIILEWKEKTFEWKK